MYPHWYWIFTDSLPTRIACSCKRFGHQLLMLLRDCLFRRLNVREAMALVDGRRPVMPLPRFSLMSPTWDRCNLTFSAAPFGMLIKREDSMMKKQLILNIRRLKMSCNGSGEKNWPVMSIM